jgi:hypothetical protein
VSDFDNFSGFVLDIRSFSTIIYIWYEGGELRPPLVRSAVGEIDLTPDAKGTDAKVSVPGGSP